MAECTLGLRLPGHFPPPGRTDDPEVTWLVRDLGDRVPLPLLSGLDGSSPSGTGQTIRAPSAFVEGGTGCSWSREKAAADCLMGKISQKMGHFCWALKDV